MVNDFRLGEGYAVGGVGVGKVVGKEMAHAWSDDVAVHYVQLDPEKDQEESKCHHCRSVHTFTGRVACKPDLLSLSIRDATDLRESRRPGNPGQISCARGLLWKGLSGVRILLDDEPSAEKAPAK